VEPPSFPLESTEHLSLLLFPVPLTLSSLDPELLSVFSKRLSFFISVKPTCLGFLKTINKPCSQLTDLPLFSLDQYMLSFVCLPPPGSLMSPPICRNMLLNHPSLLFGPFLSPCIPLLPRFASLADPPQFAVTRGSFCALIYPSPPFESLSPTRVRQSSFSLDFLFV